MPTDRFDNSLSTESSAAAADYITAVDHLFAMHNRARASIDRALEQDPGFALAHCVDARVCVLEGKTKQAISAAQRAIELSAGASVRERRHAWIVASVTRGENKLALAMVREHAKSYPRDALPLSFALGVYGLLGFGGLVDHHEQQCDLLESVAHEWGDDWWFMSWMGWSYVETGQWEKGILLLDRALVLKPDNANAAHGRVHGYYETGASQEGEKFLKQWLPTYAQDEPLHCHLAWHLALFLLQQGDAAQADEVFQTYVRPKVSQALPMFTMVDCAAFAWRAMLQGIGVDEGSLVELDELTTRHFSKPGMPFVNFHAMLARALSDKEAALRFAAEVSKQVDGEDAASVLSVTLCTAVRAFTEKRYAAAADTLREASIGVEALGGSHAQRDLITDTFVTALQRAGQNDAAEKIVMARANERASHLDLAWYRLSG